ncbi:MAG: carboxypeptidase-like regulatory domain-containing protein, partial [Ktedonobacteraceae bacterium]
MLNKPVYWKNRDEDTHLHRCAHNTVPALLVFLVIALSMFLFFLHGPTLAHAASHDTGHITGQLVDGSQNNAPVANQSVTLQLAQGNTSRDFITLTTDAQGHYSFNALESDSTVQYAVYTLYQNAQYVTDLIDLSKNADQQVNLTVYNATTSTTNMAIVQTTILLEKPNPQTGMLSVSEDFFFENLSTMTYVGSLDASQGKPNALLFALPTNARFLSLNTGFDGYRAIQVDNGFASNAAVLPGTSRFSFSFQVPYSGSSYHFSYTPAYPTLTLSLLMPLNILVNTPQGLSAQGTVNTQSGIYQTFKAQTIRANQTAQVDLGGLPVPIKAAPTLIQAPVNPATLWLVALLI